MRIHVIRYFSTSRRVASCSRDPRWGLCGPHDLPTTLISRVKPPVDPGQGSPHSTNPFLANPSLSLSLSFTLSLSGAQPLQSSRFSSVLCISVQTWFEPTTLCNLILSSSNFISLCHSISPLALTFSSSQSVFKRS